MNRVRKQRELEISVKVFSTLQLPFPLSNVHASSNFHKNERYDIVLLKDGTPVDTPWIRMLQLFSYKGIFLLLIKLQVNLGV